MKNYQKANKKSEIKLEVTGKKQKLRAFTWQAKKDSNISKIHAMCDIKFQNFKKYIILTLLIYIVGTNFEFPSPETAKLKNFY